MTQTSVLKILNLSWIFIILNTKQNPGKPVGLDQEGIFEIRWVYFILLLYFLLLDMLKVYEIERGILPFSKMLGQKVLLS